MTTPEQAAKIAYHIEEMGKVAADWDDETFAGRVVGLLIMDEGHLNKYQRTIETSMKIFRVAERIRAERAKT